MKRGDIIKGYFKDEQKIGLDTGAIVDFIYNKELFSAHIFQLEKEKGLLYTHERCMEETIKVLTKKFEYTENKSREEVREFLERFNIKIIKKDRLNSNTVKWMSKKCRESKIEFHPPDCFIIADFYKNKIKKIYSNNNHFLDACRLFGIRTVKVKTPEKEVSKQFRDMFFHR